MIISFLKKLTRGLSAIALAGLVGFALLDFLFARVFRTVGLPNAARLIEHAMLGLTFFAAVYATIDRKHIVLSAGWKGRWELVAGYAGSTSSIIIYTLLFFASMSFLVLSLNNTFPIFSIPIQFFVIPLPLGFFLMLLLEFARNTDTRLKRLLAVSGLLAGILLALPTINELLNYGLGLDLAFLYSLSDSMQLIISILKLPLILILIVLAFFGLPLFLVLGGIAGLLFLGNFDSLISVPAAAYNLLKDSSLPAIPLFTISGFLLAETGASRRLVRLFRELFGWLPGGEAIAAVLVCTFFTTFTGANGVTILALGGLLATVLMSTGSYKEEDVHGLLTASSSIGLLFPPSIAIIVYFIGANFTYQANAHLIEGVRFDMNALFIGALIPGLMLSLSMAAYGVIRSLGHNTKRPHFSAKRAGRALIASLPEILLPVLIIILWLSGIASLTEIGALVIVYLLVVEKLIQVFGRKKTQAADQPTEESVPINKVIRQALPVAGGVLIIIAMAKSLSTFIIDYGIVDLFALWVSSIVTSKVVFLLLLNLALLLVGCFMDIFSAILVIAPLVIPLGGTFGIHPVHLGVIFITNLTIGFLTPPIGMNLFLAGYAFKKPVMQIYRNVLPLFVIQLIILALITWIPALSLVFIS
ncbi:MAG: TRAP transporter large permease subunit [Spirochaetes bacterium]|nr:TRAP transporter large permease subunit [Spirochaetota bacterium]